MTNSYFLFLLAYSVAIAFPLALSDMPMLYSFVMGIIAINWIMGRQERKEAA